MTTQSIEVGVVSGYAHLITSGVLTCTDNLFGNYSRFPALVYTTSPTVGYGRILQVVTHNIESLLLLYCGYVMIMIISFELLKFII